MECLIPHKHMLKILYKSKHFPPRYKRKCEWVFFWTQCICDYWWQVSAELAELKAADVISQSVWWGHAGAADVWRWLVSDELEGVERSDEQPADHRVRGSPAGYHQWYGEPPSSLQSLWEHGKTSRDVVLTPWSRSCSRRAWFLTHSQNLWPWS